MPKDKVKEIVREYWKAFMSINTTLLIVGLALICIDLYILYYPIVELQDPKLLIIFLITEVISGGSKK